MVRWSGEHQMSIRWNQISSWAWHWWTWNLFALYFNRSVAVTSSCREAIATETKAGSRQACAWNSKQKVTKRLGLAFQRWINLLLEGSLKPFSSFNESGYFCTVGCTVYCSEVPYDSHSTWSWDGWSARSDTRTAIGVYNWSLVSSEFWTKQKWLSQELSLLFFGLSYCLQTLVSWIKYMRVDTNHRFDYIVSNPCTVAIESFNL